MDSEEPPDLCEKRDARSHIQIVPHMIFVSVAGSFRDMYRKTCVLNLPRI